MTIATKLIPAFYVVDVVGDNLDVLLGPNHKIKKISISSADLKNDLEACESMDKTIAFLKGSRDVSDELKINPEFFPTAPPIEVTPEMEEMEEIAAQAEEKIESENENAVAVAITRRFDDWGDFVVTKREIIGDGLLIRAKVAVHPRRYVLEKNIEKLEHQERLYGQGYGEDSIALH